MAKKQPPKRIAFTEARIAKLPAPTAGQVWYHDERQPGLTACVTSASRTFYLYRWAHNKPQRVRLGKWPDLTVEKAREAAKRWIGEIAAGVDPQAERRIARTVPTLKELFERWRDVYAKAHRKTWRDDERQFNKYLVEFHDRKLNTVHTADVARWHTKAGSEYGPYMANRALELLRALYNKAKDLMGHEGDNPAAAVKAFREESRDRFLQGEELPAFFAAVNRESELYRDFLLMLLFTGARRANVQSMRWEDIHLGVKVWRIPTTKSGVPVVVPLCGPAMEILGRRLALCGQSPWVFPAPSRTGHLVEPRKAWRRVCRAAGIENLRLHDLRRSLGSWQVITGSSLAVVGKSLGHTSPEATAVYARLTLDPVRTSIDRATQAMLSAANGTATAPPQ